MNANISIILRINEVKRDSIREIIEDELNEPQMSITDDVVVFTLEQEYATSVDLVSVLHEIALETDEPVLGWFCGLDEDFVELQWVDHHDEKRVDSVLLHPEIYHEISEQVDFKLNSTDYDISEVKEYLSPLEFEALTLKPEVFFNQRLANWLKPYQGSVNENSFKDYIDKITIEAKSIWETC
ncbi:hypothetical protein AAEU29_09900 [Pseudoalteromonas sp. SSM20]|uniref:hypothetical protein n=1 Tax=Pseudoalteromonas sp. SSM20 TaxID=3139394 RepID=UPI003BA8B4C9